MSDDPGFYKLLALLSIAIWGTFLVRYSIRLHRVKFWQDREGSTFAWALLILGVSMVLYGLVNVLRQFLGLDYFGRDAARIVASIGLSVTGLVFHRLISKQPSRK